MKPPPPASWPRPPTRQARLREWWILSAAAVVYAAIAAWRRVWWCDDAFISFRYARHLNAGLGLVYNAGERVEGYSNFLWTMWIALGMRLGVSPEAWSAAWGIAFYAGAVALLCALQVRDAWARGAAWIGLPLAALLAATHRDASVFATSGLETALATFLLLAAYGLAVESSWGARGAAACGLVTALAALTRPEAILLAPVIGAWILWARRPRGRDAMAFAAGFLVLWAPFLAWRVAYYGDFFPNPYYAKSAWLPWYRQGWIYLGLYARQYGVVLAGLPVVIVAWAARPNPDPGWTRRVVLAGALAVSYTAYVVRVGGDFMYARLLLPATPFSLILLERGLSVLFRDRVIWQEALAALLVATMLLVPYPFAGKDGPAGIANEPLYYPADDLETQRREGATLRRYFEGTPASVAYCGSQARLVYYADPAVAIECATGLTDRWIARQPLAHRGRVGHEKQAPVSYLLRRRVDFTLGYTDADLLHLADSVPWTRIWFDDVPGNIVHWDSALLAEMARRGARFPDLPRYLEGYGAAIDAIPVERVRADFERFRRFYFDYASDSSRAAPFVARLEEGGGR
jgi:hypothetical protein